MYVCVPQMKVLNKEKVLNRSTQTNTLKNHTNKSRT